MDEESEEAHEAVLKEVRGIITEEEVERHGAACHWSYRSQCKFCVMGHGAGGSHHKVKRGDEESTVPHVSMDYMYIGGCEQDIEEDGIMGT